MPIITGQKSVVAGFGLGEREAPEDSPVADEVLGAATLYNPIVAAVDYINRPAFPEKPDFNPAEYGKDNELWLDHFRKLGITRSPEEFDETVRRIRDEQLSRSVLDAAGGWGLAAEIVSGSLTPTMAIPLVGQYRGIKGVMQTLAYAGTAASVDELALLKLRETYSETEAMIGIAAGTVLGGALGGAVKYLSPAQRVGIEDELYASAGMAPPTKQGAISSTPLQVTYKAPRSDFVQETPGFEPSVVRESLRSALSDIPPEQIDENLFERILEFDGVEEMLHQLKIRNADELKSVLDQKVRPPRTDDQSLSAGGRVRPAPTLDVDRVAAKVLIGMLKGLNPVTRLGTQTYSPAARRLALQMGDAGLLTTGNKAGVPHAPEGTLEARLVEYDSIVGQYLLAHDDAFSRHIEGDRLPDDQLQGAVVAQVKSWTGQASGKMTRKEFNAEVFRVAQTGETHPDPAVMKSVEAYHKMFDRFKEYAEEAYEHRVAEGDVGRRLFDPEGNLGPDVENYVAHVFDENEIAADPQGFHKMLMDNYESIMQSALKKDYDRYLKRKGKVERELEILTMTPEESRAQLTEVNKNLEILMGEEPFKSYELERLRIQREIREAKAAGDEATAESLKIDLEDMREADPELQIHLRMIADQKALRRELSKATGEVESARQDLINKAIALEEQDLNALERVLNAGVRLAKALDKVSDKAQAAELKTLWKRVATNLRKVETQDKRILNLYKKKKMSPDEQFVAYQKAMVFGSRRAEADAKAEEFLTKIDEVESMDLDQQRELLRAVQDLNMVRIRDLNARRAIRGEELREKADALSPEKLEMRREQLESDLSKMWEDFEERWRMKGADDLDMETGSASFKEAASKTAEELTNKILKLDNPIAGLDILHGERGPELARVLNIPLEIKSKYLEKDPERIARIYARKMAPDIEMYRATGSVNGSKVFADLRDEFFRLKTRISESDIRPKKRNDLAAWLKGEPVDLLKVETIPFKEADKAEALQQLFKAQKETERDLRVMVDRFRRQRGVPADPSSIMFRLGRAAKDINVARYMGSVAISSLPDVARPVMKFGFVKTFKHGWGQYARGMSEIKALRAEAKRIGVAWETIMHNRIHQVADVVDDYAQRKTVVERGIGFVANKTGFVAMFDRWTSEMKQVTAAIAIGEMSEALAIAVGAKTVSPKKAQWYKTYLAKAGIDERMAHRIWDQHKASDGSEEFSDGFLLPNTENWTDLQAARAYKAGINGVVNEVIVTPGLEMPNWTDENIAFSLLGQFKSFTFASTTRVVLSGAQQSDMALVNGMAFSLAMGSVSYYLWAMSIGGDALKEAQKFNMDSWADEAIARSGLLGVFAEPYEIAQKIPATQDLVTFADQRTTRRRGTGLVETGLGPTFDLINSGAAVVAGFDDPTRSTLHQARLMGPWQNVFWFRRAIDAVEDGIGDTFNLPERRGQ